MGRRPSLWPERKRSCRLCHLLSHNLVSHAKGASEDHVFLWWYLKTGLQYYPRSLSNPDLSNMVQSSENLRNQNARPLFFEDGLPQFSCRLGKWRRMDGLLAWSDSVRHGHPGAHQASGWLSSMKAKLTAVAIEVRTDLEFYFVNQRQADSWTGIHWVESMSQKE